MMGAAGMMGGQRAVAAIPPVADANAANPPCYFLCSIIICAPAGQSMGY